MYADVRHGKVSQYVEEMSMSYKLQTALNRQFFLLLILYNVSQSGYPAVSSAAPPDVF